MCTKFAPLFYILCFILELFKINWNFVFQVTATLRKNEFNQEVTSGSVKSFDSNQLASNDPIEDTRSEAICKMTTGRYLQCSDHFKFVQTSLHTMSGQYIAAEEGNI